MSVIEQEVSSGKEEVQKKSSRAREVVRVRLNQGGLGRNSPVLEWIWPQYMCVGECTPLCNTDSHCGSEVAFGTVVVEEAENFSCGQCRLLSQNIDYMQTRFPLMMTMTTISMFPTGYSSIACSPTLLHLQLASVLLLRFVLFLFPSCFLLRLQALFSSFMVDRQLLIVSLFP